MRRRTVISPMLDNGLPRLPPGKMYSLTLAARMSSMMATARSHKGTRCSCPPFMRAIGMIQSLLGVSTSDHLAPSTGVKRKKPLADKGLERGFALFSWVYELCPGGEGGIRTRDTLASMPHFECGAFNHSATSPRPLDLAFGP